MAKTDFLAPADLRIVGSRLSIAGEAQFSLAAMGTTKIPDGALVYVQSVKAYFQLDRGSTATPDGSTVVAAYQATGNWLRLEIDFAGESPWLSQTDWYVNANTGSDDNDGATSGTALATFAELQRRFGENPLIDDKTYNVYVESDVAEYLRLEATFQGKDAAIWIHGGVKQIVASDTLTSWADFDAGVEPSIVGTSITDFSGYKGARVTFTSGAISGYVFYLGNNPNSGAVSNEDWRHGCPSHYVAGGFSEVTTFRFECSDTSPSPGDTFQIEKVWQIQGVQLISHRLDTGGDGGSNMAGFILSDLQINRDVPSEEALNYIQSDPVPKDVGYGQTVLFQCSIYTNYFGNSARFVGCAAVDQDGSAGLQIPNIQIEESLDIDGLSCGGASFRACFINDLENVFADVATSSRVQFLYGTEDRSIQSGTVEIGIWRSAAAQQAIYVDDSSSIHVADIWGASPGASDGIVVQGKMFVPAVASISSFAVTGNDTVVGGTVRTYAQLPYVEPTNNAMIALALP